MKKYIACFEISYRVDDTRHIIQMMQYINAESPKEAEKVLYAWKRQCFPTWWIKKNFYLVDAENVRELDPGNFPTWELNEDGEAVRLRYHTKE